MKLVALIDFFRNRLKTVIRLSLAALAVLVVLDALPFLVNKEHAHTEIERFPGFWSLYGLLGCMLLIIASKKFGHSGIMTREDYYDE